MIEERRLANVHVMQRGRRPAPGPQLLCGGSRPYKVIRAKHCSGLMRNTQVAM